MFLETDPFRWAKGKLLFACHVVSVVEIEREQFLLGRRPGVHLRQFLPGQRPRVHLLNFLPGRW